MAHGVGVEREPIGEDCMPYRAIVYLGGLIIAATAWAAGTENSRYWERFEVAIEVELSGDLLVTETQTVVLNRSSDAMQRRRLNLEKADAITDVQVVEDGQERRVSTHVQDDQAWIEWRAASGASERRTVVLRYRVQGAVRLRSDGDQVVWTALSDERQGEIQRGTVTVRVPEVWAQQIKGFTHYGAAADATLADSRTVSFTSQQHLSPSEGLTVKVVGPHGLLNAEEPRWQRGEEAPYTLPGLVGQIDTVALIGFAGGLIMVALFIGIQSSRTATEGALPDEESGLQWFSRGR